MKINHLDAAIAAAGGPVALGARLGITSQAVSQWARCPAERVIDVADATGGAVTAHDLRPDLPWTHHYGKRSA